MTQNPLSPYSLPENITQTFRLSFCIRETLHRTLGMEKELMLLQPQGDLIQSRQI